jgi:hypothetical protein
VSTDLRRLIVIPPRRSNRRKNDISSHGRQTSYRLAESSQSTAFIRLLAQAGMGFVPFLPLLDLLWPLWDDHRQTLHDKAVGCYVINNPQ